MNPEQAPPIDLVQQGIEKAQKAIYTMAAILIISIMIFIEIGCTFLRICFSLEDIDIPPYVSFIYVPSLLLSLLLGVLTYQSADYVYIDCLRPLRYILLFWSVILIGVTIAEFIAGMVLSGADDRSDVWDSLTPLGQEFYDNDEDNLASAYRLNMSIVCIFQIISGVILLAITVTVWVLYRRAPNGYVPLKEEYEPPFESEGNGEIRNLEAPNGDIEMRNFPDRMEEDEPDYSMDRESEYENLHPLGPPEGY